MSTARIGSRYRSAPQGLSLRALGLGLLTLAAVIAMHGIDPIAAARATGSTIEHHVAEEHATAATAEHSHDTTAQCHHGDPTHQQCPSDRHRHHGQMCQSGSLNQGFVLPAVPAAFEGLHVDQSPPLVATAAEDAADGSGCGPPSLLKLAISRT